MKILCPIDKRIADRGQINTTPWTRSRLDSSFDGDNSEYAGSSGGGMGERKTERKRTKRNDIIRLVATALMIINGREPACICGDQKDKADG